LLHSLRNRICLLIVIVLIISVAITNIVAVKQVRKHIDELINNISYFILDIAKSNVNSKIKRFSDQKAKLAKHLQNLFTNISSIDDFIFIVNKQGKIIVKSKNIRLTKAQQIILKNQLFPYLLKCTKKQKYCTIVKTIETDIHGLSKWNFNATKTAIPNWLIVHASWFARLVLPGHELIIDLLFLNAFVLILGLIVIMLAITKLTNPLRSLTRHLTNLPLKGFALNEDAKKEVNSLAQDKNDIAMLAKSFLQLNTSLQGYITNLRRTTAAKERMIGELKSARKIQLDLLPENNFPKLEHCNFEIHALLKPARQVGGDFYDFEFIDKNHFYFTVGDVSDKNIASAMFMAISKTLIHSKIKENLSPGEVVSQVNTELINRNKSNMFVTLFVGILNTDSGELLYTNAGHLPPILLRKQQAPTFLIDDIQPMAGVMQNISYQTHKLTLSKRDMLFVYTDGVTEAANKQGELFSEQKLFDFIKKNGNLTSVKDIIQRLLIQLAHFAKYEPQADDITVLALRYRGNEKSMSISQTSTAQLNIQHKDGFNLLTLPAEIDSIEKFRAFIDAQTKNDSVAQKMIHDVFLATEEAVINIVKHAYPDRKPGSITVGIKLDKGKLIHIIIQDEGMPFDPTKLGPPQLNQKLEHLSIGGLGCHLINQLTNELSYTFKDGKNILNLKFNLC
jgi:sigma-B regulation protein RsbU (phosphoserine phosphatase)